jgi:hypothetical protein
LVEALISFGRELSVVGFLFALELVVELVVVEILPLVPQTSAAGQAVAQLLRHLGEIPDMREAGLSHRDAGGYSQHRSGRDSAEPGAFAWLRLTVVKGSLRGRGHDPPHINAHAPPLPVGHWDHPSVWLTYSSRPSAEAAGR